MVDDQDLEGLDPYELMATEAGRLDAFFSSGERRRLGRSPRAARAGTRATCSRISPRARTTTGRASTGRCSSSSPTSGAKGAVDLASANDIGIHEFDGQTPEQILETWRTRSAAEPRGLPGARRRRRRQQRRRVPGAVAGVPPRVRARDPRRRRRCPGHARPRRAAAIDWQARFGRFALKELKPDLDRRGDAAAARTCKGDGIDIDLPNEQFVDAVAARLPADSGIDAETAAILSATP